ncbi:hypothetical protein ACFOZ5_03665 [Marinobacter lacisalsi]|uniref:Lipoprotein n=1 Tax=Marinobacter lacisalsi TaxID=475979 RepID=A0ABV8QCQ0_9GAMM
MPHSLKRPLTILLIGLLSGCATPPWLKDVWDRPHYEEVELTQDEHVRLGYLARYLAESDTRAKLESQILQTDYVRQWDAGDYSTATSMATDAVQGQIASDLGAELGAVVLVLGLMSGDGSMEYISQAFLPAEIDGEIIPSVKAARIATNALIRKRLEQVATALDTTLECVQGCDNHPDSIFTLKLPANKPDERFIYWPADIVITVDVGGLTAVSPKDPVSSLVGFPVAWKTQPGNSAAVRLYSNGSYDKNGQLEFEPNPGNRKIDPIVKHDMEPTALGLSILRTVYSDAHLLWGSQSMHPGMIFFDDQVHGFISNGRVAFVNQKVEITRLAPGNPGHVPATSHEEQK